jgi:hypothetical protein
MVNLDLIKNFAIVTVGLDASQNQIYGVAFAALRSNTQLFLVALASNEKSVPILELHINTLTFIHPEQWENLFNNEEIVQAYKTAYSSSPEDWPCGFVRTLFTGATSTRQIVNVC